MLGSRSSRASSRRTAQEIDEARPINKKGKMTLVKGKVSVKNCMTVCYFLKN